MSPPGNYSESIRWLYARNQFAVKLGLENPRKLFAALDHPDRGLPLLHVAGTNGKGSVCVNLAAMLRALGVPRVGLYTSPHLVSFRERIRVDGEAIPARAVREWMHDAWDALEELNPTYFECVTGMALSWFRERECGAAVLETGLGGRLDATNVVTPRVSVITPVSLDHTDILGNTLEAILREKLGIVKPGVPLVIDAADPALARVAEGVAHEAGSPCVNLEGRLHPGPEGWMLRGRFRNYALPADLRSADWQFRNAALSVLALESFFGEALPGEERWLPALLAARMPGRMQWLRPAANDEGGQRLPVVLDGAHNPAGIEALCRNLVRARQGQRPRVFFSAMQDKDIATMFAALQSFTNDLVFVDLSGVFPRALAPSALRGRIGDAAAIRIVRPDDEALDPLLRHGAGADYAVFCGSLYMLGEVIPLLARHYRGLEELARLREEDGEG